ncbi:flavin reductase family protein [Maricaulis sp.]|uniref:flavin reductase family protein n=1 Tax=Maricaulis sp. TaxID=1486257 RepID=UPI00261F6602|nr:flavin reductase family protein [Maricaulis sp.]
MPDSRSFRDALGRYPTGVTIVSAYVDGRAVGMTVNSFASVSLEPRLLLWSVEKATERYRLFRNAKTYAINVLAADQAGLAHACALDADLRACHADWTGEAAPLIEGCVSRFLCRQTAVHPGGDHDIIVGEVTDFDTPREAPALVFYSSTYCEPG